MQKYKEEVICAKRGYRPHTPDAAGAFAQWGFEV
jgi:hypothetical protein